MSDPRTTHQLGHHPNAYFRCVVCQQFATTTERGVCPRCGFVAPTVTKATDRIDPRIWRRASLKLRADRDPPTLGWLWWPLLALIAFLVIGLTAL